MPTYQFRCERCGKRREFFVPVAELAALEEETRCCGQRMLYDWTHSVRHRPFRPFTTKHVNGSPMEITSLSQLRRIEKQFNVNFPAYGGTMMPDVDMGMPESHWVDDAGHTHKD